jgi:hypothetical protein
MKRTVLFLSLFTILALQSSSLLACPACEQQQASAFTGITHGATPQGVWEYAIASVITAMTLLIAIASMKALMRGTLSLEQSNEHIKHTILDR